MHFNDDSHGADENVVRIRARNVFQVVKKPIPFVYFWLQ